MQNQPSLLTRRRTVRLLLLLATGEGVTIAALREALGVGERTIRYGLEALEAEGLSVERIHRGGEGRAGRAPTLYRLSDAARQRLRRSFDGAEDALVVVG